MKIAMETNKNSLRIRIKSAKRSRIIREFRKKQGKR
jgi:hypothetical protein